MKDFWVFALEEVKLEEFADSLGKQLLWEFWVFTLEEVKLKELIDSLEKQILRELVGFPPLGRAIWRNS